MLNVSAVDEHTNFESVLHMYNYMLYFSDSTLGNFNVKDLSSLRFHLGGGGGGRQGGHLTQLCATMRAGGHLMYVLLGGQLGDI